MRGEGVGQPERRGELRAIEAGAEDPQRHLEPRSRHRLHELARLQRAEQRLQFEDVVRKILGAGGVAAQGAQRLLVGPRRAAEAEIDAAGIERFQRAELFGDDDRRMIGQHDSARADPHRLRAGRDKADRHRGRRAGDSHHVVMLGEPVATIAPKLGVPGEVERTAQRLRRRRSQRHRREIENRERRRFAGRRHPCKIGTTGSGFKGSRSL